LSGQRDSKSKPRFDGTFRSLIYIYESDPESPYNARIKRGVRRTYSFYVKRLINHIGNLRIDLQDGRDVKRWFAQWRTDPDGSDHLPRANTVLSVLKAAVSWGVVCRLAGCRDLQAVLSELNFPHPRPRTFAPTAQQIEAARKAAHDAGSPGRALLYALIYDTTGRTFDFLGQWVPMSDKKPSAILHRGKKWIGPHWSAIDDNLMITIKPTKTEETSEVEVVFDLAACPMITEELASIPPESRNGPLIINEATGLPYKYQTFLYAWRRDFAAAGLPKGMWCRDLRAGGVTEGGKAGASLDDRRKVAGHTQAKQTEKYDRDKVEAFRRTMKSRVDYRKNEM
jgi:hypothetical protein